MSNSSTSSSTDTVSLRVHIDRLEDLSPTNCRIVLSCARHSEPALRMGDRGTNGTPITWSGSLFNPLSDQLSVALFSDDTSSGRNSGQQQLFIGEATLDLIGLPRGTTVSRRLPVLRGPAAHAPAGYVHVSVTAHGFGAQADNLFLKSDLVLQYVRAFHTADEPLQDAVVCMGSGRVYRGLQEALDDVASLHAQSVHRSHANSTAASAVPDTSKVVLLFPGRYMLLRPYELDRRFDGLLLFAVGAGGIDGPRPVSIEPFGSGGRPQQPTLDIVDPITVTLHGLARCGPIVCRARGIHINANAMDMSGLSLCKPVQRGAKGEGEAFVPCSNVAIDHGVGEVTSTAGQDCEVTVHLSHLELGN